MNLDSVKALLIGTAIAFSGGLLRVLISIQNKEKKKAVGTHYHADDSNYCRFYNELFNEQGRVARQMVFNRDIICVGLWLR
jgi:hypothetical protein